MTLLKNWCKLDIDSDNLDSYTNKHDDWNLVFAHHKEEDKIYPPPLTEIADAKRKDQELKVYFKKNIKMPQKDVGLHLIEDTKVLVLCRLDMYRTNVLMYLTMVLLAHPTKGRVLDV